ncbi:hypothetical protein DB32_006956 [Sandaracinus amylolyticus]|uniref:Lipoprotein n=2 Tax=Sandaracinus amylolyticus TaxID=927083 RepID=A0A0F6YM23_9BACT|nr:hypothetical protein DB32_006956 [Sandaracinus amylolyticus]
MLAALAIASVVAGCSTPSTGYPPAAPVATARRLENLQAVASRHTACPAREIGIRQVSERVFSTMGCGVVREYALVQGSRYAEWQPIMPVNMRAANEMVCPLERLVVSAPTENVRQVSGCGRSAQYQLACDVSQCEWAMTTPPAGAGATGRVVEATPPPGRVTAPTPSTPDSSVVVVPQRADPAVDQAIRGQLDARRSAIRACVPRGELTMVRAQWGRDGMVRLSLDPPWQGTQSERCVQQSVGQLQVTTGEAGAISHVVR